MRHSVGGGPRALPCPTDLVVQRYLKIQAILFHSPCDFSPLPFTQLRGLSLNAPHFLQRPVVMESGECSGTHSPPYPVHFLYHILLSDFLKVSHGSTNSSICRTRAKGETCTP